MSNLFLYSHNLTKESSKHLIPCTVQVTIKINPINNLYGVKLEPHLPSEENKSLSTSVPESGAMKKH